MMLVAVGVFYKLGKNTIIEFENGHELKEERVWIILSKGKLDGGS